MTFAKIAAIIAEKLEIETADITMESSFDDLQADSLYIAEIMMDIEDAFGIDLDNLGSAECVGDIVDYVEAQLQK